MNDSRRVANLAKHVVVQAGTKKAERDNGIFHHTEESEEAEGRRGRGREEREGGRPPEGAQTFLRRRRWFCRIGCGGMSSERDGAELEWKVEEGKKIK